MTTPTPITLLSITFLSIPPAAPIPTSSLETSCPSTR